MIKGSITSIINVGAQVSSSTLAVGALTVAAAVAVGFLFMFNEAAYQKGAQRRAFGGHMPAKQPETAPAKQETGVATVAAFAAEDTTQPAFAGELIAVVKDLATRVMAGQAPVAELIAMLDMLERMGVKVKGLFSIGPAYHSPKLVDEKDLQTA
ncbi:MAG: hypothetical protein PW788_07145 [Micavibrio sp.]|nr:hypothetical protein [Micavibrio sp.]